MINLLFPLKKSCKFHLRTFRHSIFFGSLALFSLLLLTTFVITKGPIPPTSEIAYTEHSPSGEEAGSVVPASCDSAAPFGWAGMGGLYFDWSTGVWRNSGSHFNGDCLTTCPTGVGTYDPYYNPSASGCCVATTGWGCWSAPNACGAQGWGTINCAGACTGVTPANPWWYGNACVSPANNCGSTNSGAIGCSGGCNAVAPADIPLGTACQGPANACGMRTPGVITCSGCDSTVAPSDALCDLAVCKNSCVSTLDRTGSFTVASGPPATTLKACFYQAGTGACASGVDVTNAATWTETNAPKDVLYFSPTGVLNARYVNGDETFSVSYLGVTKSPTVTVICVPNTCAIAAARTVTDTYCPEVTQDTGVYSGCDGLNLVCPGTRKCNYNWRETAP